MKKIDTLVTDIHKVLEGHGGWDEYVNEHFGTAMKNLMDARLNTEYSGSGSIRMSNVGQPCSRKLWYHTHSTAGEPLRPEARLKFLYGDIIEEVLLSLAEAAGHDVQGRQDLMELNGIKGHRDGVIDGMLVDVKSASTYSFAKFKENRLKEEDPFGYIGQISAYLAASQDDPLVTNKTQAAFLAMDKQHGHVCLDIYDLTEEIEQVQKTIEERKVMVDQPSPPTREFKEEPYQKSGNMALPLNCSYCEYKKACWPGVRTFLYGKKVVHLSKVAREPKVPEVK